MRLGQVVGVDRAAGHADDRQAGLGLPVPAEVVGHAHRAGRVAGHRVDAAVRRAGADRDDGGRLGRQPVQPLGGRHRLAGRRVVAEAAPVALVLDRLVGDRALDHEDERLELTAVGLVPPLDEVVGALLRTALEVDQRPVHRDLRQPRQRPEHDLLDAGLGGRGQGDRVAVAAEPTVHPEDVDNGLGRAGLPTRRSLDWCLSGHAGHLLTGKWRIADLATPGCRRDVMLKPGGSGLGTRLNRRSGGHKCLACPGGRRAGNNDQSLLFSPTSKMSLR